MSTREPIAFSRAGLTLRGVLHRPAAPSSEGVILLHGWGGYRVGPHEILRDAAYALADRGLNCLRFDFLGRGDSDGAAEEHDLNSMIEDAKAAAAFARESLGWSCIYAIGICSGGEVAVGAMHDGLRLDGCALWSSPVFSADATTARRARKSIAYLGEYLLKLFRPQTWGKLLSGRVRFDIIKRVLVSGGTHVKKGGERAEIGESDTLAGGAAAVLMIYGTADPIAEEAIRRYTGLFERAGSGVRLETIEGANHGFYSGPWRQRVIELTVEWLEQVVRARA